MVVVDWNSVSNSSRQSSGIRVIDEYEVRGLELEVSQDAKKSKS